MRECLGGCQWSEWSACSEAGECSPGEEESRVCGSDVGACVEGRSRRSCDAECRWSDFGPCEGGVEAEVEICGSALDEDCDGTVLRAPDQYEPNNDCSSCTLLSPDEDPSGEIFATIDSVEDRRDFYCFDAGDSTFNPFESISLSLTNIPIGADYDIFLYSSLEECERGNALAQGIRAAGQPEEIDWGERRLVDDNGRYYIKIQQVFGQSCEIQYRLTYRGLD